MLAIIAGIALTTAMKMLGKFAAMLVTTLMKAFSSVGRLLMMPVTKPPMIAGSWLMIATAMPGSAAASDGITLVSADINAGISVGNAEAMLCPMDGSAATTVEPNV